MHEQIDIFTVAVAPHGKLLERKGDLPSDFVIVPNFVSNAEESDLIARIDAAPWSDELKRRVQHYGYRYDYKARAINARDYIGALPPWADGIAHRLVDCDYFAAFPDQVIVNEYEPGQGISPHTDRTTCFGPVIASLSLGSDVVMDFNDGKGRSGSLLLSRCSMLVLRGAARSEWRHGIAHRQRDVINATTVQRRRRVSLTFRSILLTGA
jgi:alkylated DNA repair dioxygenase AlkB